MSASESCEMQREPTIHATRDYDDGYSDEQQVRPRSVPAALALGSVVLHRLFAILLKEVGALTMPRGLI